MEQPSGIYETYLDKNEANFSPLTPLSFVKRTAEVFPQRTAVIHGELRRSWLETYQRCVRLASSLSGLGIGKGDTVSVMAPNVPAMLEAHFGVPMTGAVLNALNVRLDSEAVAFILEHGEAKALLVDREFSPVVARALSRIERELPVIEIDDAEAPPGETLGGMDYEVFLQQGDPNFKWQLPKDEWDAISLNYTSGTTGNPKGVVYHHRGAYLNALGNVTAWALPHHPVYLWTLPMFHCNGWCFPWSITAMAGTHVCLRRVEADAIFRVMREHQVTHLCGAPIVMNTMANAPEAQEGSLPHAVKMMTAGSAPPAAILEKMSQAGFDVTHAYGLTEVYGPVVLCAWHEEWDTLPISEQAALKARQGVRYPVLEDFYVADPSTFLPVPGDGKTIGELFMRGNVVMKGYLKNPSATDDSFLGGYFHTGDLGVMHPDGYVEIKDRSKDIVISGGENISTIEIEGVIYKHPAVLEVAVVAKPDEKWGETPCAFVTLKKGERVTAEELIEFCRNNLAHYKCPTHIVFSELPKTSTGKIQKFKLRKLTRQLEQS